MAIIESFLRRPIAILKMPEAIARGLSVTAFINELKSAGLSYRRTLMLADWRSVANIEARKDLIKYVRKDRLPSIKMIADVEWNLSHEYMYKMKVSLTLRPDEPITEKFVNIMSDTPLTPTEVEQIYYKRYYRAHSVPPAELKGVMLIGAYRRVESIEAIE